MDILESAPVAGETSRLEPQRAHPSTEPEIVSELRSAIACVRSNDPSRWPGERPRVEIRRRLRFGEARIDVGGVTGVRPTKVMCEEFGAALAAVPEIEGVQVKPPFVHVKLDLDVLLRRVVRAVEARADRFGCGTEGVDDPCVVSFGSPGTNKPLHIGHLRICFTGLALSRLMEARSHPTVRFQMLSDHGIHVAQTMAAYDLWHQGEEPTIKSDHYVGQIYAEFNRAAADEAAPPPSDDDDPVADEEAIDTLRSPLHEHAAEMLRRVDACEPEALALHARLTEWAIEGIRRTYARIGVEHDLEFREYELLPLAREVIAAAMEGGLCGLRPDGSTYVDLGEDHGEVTLLRGDGTALVFAQFIGTWVQRSRMHPGKRILLVAGDQWSAGLAALFSMLRTLGYPEATHGEHVTVGMVTGRANEKLSSRAGTAATGDEILDDLQTELLATWPASGDDRDLVRTVVCDRLAVGTLKFHLLGAARSAPMTFDPSDLGESICRFGAVVRALAVAEAAAGTRSDVVPVAATGRTEISMRRLLAHVDDFGEHVERAARQRDPSIVVRHVEDTCELVRSAARPDLIPPAVWAAVALSLRRALELVAIDLPPSLHRLPPAFSPDGAVSSRPPSR